MLDIDSNLLLGGAAAVIVGCYAYRNLDCCGINIHDLTIVKSWRIRKDSNSDPSDEKDILVLKMCNDNNIVWALVYVESTSSGGKVDTSKPILYSSNACIDIYNCNSSANVCSDGPGKILINDLHNVSGKIWSKKSERTKHQMKNAIQEMIDVVCDFDSADGLANKGDTAAIDSAIENGVDSSTEFYTNAGDVKELLQDFRDCYFDNSTC